MLPLKHKHNISFRFMVKFFFSVLHVVILSMIYKDYYLGL